ncbi:Uncharacterized protein dnm_032770 [Desulfonema magnum]|uniref:Uncharacterized protein n=1 Tax=Desulfonema magnum TaxID=45655 RepID=A0A975BKI8_9BACT|nr:Uncharacterized protein dnm_032770 [Desulfonema magnum]
MPADLFVNWEKIFMNNGNLSHKKCGFFERNVLKFGFFTAEYME